MYRFNLLCFLLCLMGCHGSEYVLIAPYGPSDKPLLAILIAKEEAGTRDAPIFMQRCPLGGYDYDSVLKVIAQYKYGSKASGKGDVWFSYKVEMSPGGEAYYLIGGEDSKRFFDAMLESIPDEAKFALVRGAMAQIVEALGHYGVK